MKTKSLPRYLLKAHGLEWSTYGDQIGSDRLSYKVSDVQTSLVRLELEADSLRFVKTVAVGVLDLVTVS